MLRVAISSLRSNSILIISAYLMLVGCKKDVMYSDSLPINDANFGFVYDVDSVIAGGYWDGQLFEIDIDDDGEYDARFDVFGYGSPGSGIFLVTALNVLNEETSISADLFSDTLFYQSSYNTDVQGPNTYLIETHTTSCTNSPGADSTKLVDYTIAHTYGNSDVISNDADTWVESVRQLIHPGSTSTPNSTYLGGDSTLIVFTNINTACYDFPFNEVKTVAFRKVSGSNAKLAWVRFTILGSATVHIHSWGRSF